MAHVVIFTRRDRGVLPALELLEHRVTALPATAESVARAPGGDLLIVDAVGELARGEGHLPPARRRRGARAARARRGRLRGRHPRVGCDRHRARRGRSRRGRGAHPARTRGRARRGAGRDERAHDRRGELPGQGRRPARRPHLQGVRAAALPLRAPRARVHARAAAERGVGLRLLRRHAHGRRARAAPAGQARRPRDAHRHGARRRLPFELLDE